MSMELDLWVPESVARFSVLNKVYKSISRTDKMIEDYCNDLREKYARMYEWAGWLSKENPAVLTK